MTEQEWTPKQDELIRGLRARGESLEYIAQRAATTAGAVARRLAKLRVESVVALKAELRGEDPIDPGPTQRRWTSSEDERLLALLVDDAPITEVFFSFDRSPAAVLHRMIALGLLDDRSRQQDP